MTNYAAGGGRTVRSEAWHAGTDRAGWQQEREERAAATLAANGNERGELRAPRC